eukprot:COSAG03_NODE_794_length_5827_cov_2.167947_6_plen_75_part_00
MLAMVMRTGITVKTAARNKIQLLQLRFRPSVSSQVKLGKLGSAVSHLLEKHATRGARMISGLTLRALRASRWMA